MEITVEKSASGDFVASSLNSFSYFDIQKAIYKIYFEFGKSVNQWPIMTDVDVDTGVFDVWFLDPFDDSEYLNHEPLT